MDGGIKFDMNGNTKPVHRSVRISSKAEELLVRLSDVCNKYHVRVNGDDEVNPSVLLTYLIEKLANSTGNKENELFDALVRIFEVRDSEGRELESIISRGISREVVVKRV